MRFDILTIFPSIFDSYFSHSLMARGQKLGLIKIAVHDIRKFARDKHKTVDDRPYGGGVGMVMKVDIIHNALRALRISNFPARLRLGEVKAGGQFPISKNKGKTKTRVILMTPQGKVFNQNHAKRLAKYDRLIIISGRYEGYDERIRKLADEEISIGDYILTGGELPAMVVTDAVARLQPGVVGKEQSLVDESFSNGLLEYPQYTRPAEFRGMKVPKVLFSGNHKKIDEWRREQSMKVTKKKRPDLLK